MTDLKGKWGLVTGAGRGLGKLAAQVLAEYGCNLILHSRSVSSTGPVAEDLRRKYGIEVWCVEADLEDPRQPESMMNAIDKNGRIPDIILNNAGVQVAYRSEIYDTPAADYITSFKVNTIAPMMICYHYLPGMIEKGFGRIVNTTSGIRLEPEQGGYSASKAALDKVTTDIGSRLDGTDVMINLADPGWCRTDLGGPLAPNSPESAVPGIVIGAFIDDRKSGRLFRSEDFHGMTLEQAVEKAMQTDSPY
ncbi:MAG: SDR family NAD(P)-dependent oxidoreductase [Porcipelethomonas sp.]